MTWFNYLGVFTSLAALWESYPEGGTEGDYCEIGSTFYGWNKYTRQWAAIDEPEEVPEEEQEPAEAQQEEAPQTEEEEDQDVNFLGEYETLNEAWAAIPEGGQDGDYITINDVRYRWSNILRNWVVSTATVAPLSSPSAVVSTNQSDINYLGAFASIADVWVFYPEGGREGDYIYIVETETIYSWDVLSRSWIVNYDPEITVSFLLDTPSTSIRINYLGDFESIELAWIVHPEGGYEGDYIHVDDDILLWNKLYRNWGDSGNPSTPAIISQTVYGDLRVIHDLHVSGTITADYLVLEHAPFYTKEEIEALLDPYAKTNELLQTVTVGETQYNVSGRNVTIPAYPTLSTLNAVGRPEILDFVTHAELIEAIAGLPNPSAQIADLVNKVSILMGRVNWDNYFGIDENENIYVKKKSNDEGRHLYSFANIIAGGRDDGSGSGSGSGSGGGGEGGGGVDIARVWQSFTNVVADGTSATSDNNYHVNPAHLPIFSVSGDVFGEISSFYVNETRQGTIQFALTIAKGSVSDLTNEDTANRLWSGAVIAQYVASVVANATSFRGDFDASTGAIADTEDTLTSIEEKPGHMYVVSAEGTFCGKALDVGDSIIFKREVAAGTAPVAADITFVQGVVKVTNNSATLVLNTDVNLASVEGVNITAKLPNLYTAGTTVAATAAQASLLGVTALSNALSSTAGSDSSRVEWDSQNGAWHFYGNVYIDGWGSVGGLNSGSGGGSIDIGRVWQSLANNPADQAYEYTLIAAAHIPVGTGIIRSGNTIAIDTSVINLSAYKTIDSLKSKGTETLPVYFDASGDAQTITSYEGTASKANELATARTLWGQSFDGSENITGAISNAGNITSATSGTYDLGATDNFWSNAFVQKIYLGSSSTYIQVTDGNIELHVGDGKGFWCNGWGSVGGLNSSSSGSIDLDRVWDSLTNNTDKPNVKINGTHIPTLSVSGDASATIVVGEDTIGIALSIAKGTSTILETGTDTDARLWSAKTLADYIGGYYTQGTGISISSKTISINSTYQNYISTAYNAAHSHSNKSVLDDISSTDVSHWATAYNASHTHSNKSTLDGITSSDITAWNAAYGAAHSHSNKSTLDNITSTKVSNWDSAYSDAHTHSNKSTLDGISSTKVSNWDAAYGWGDHDGLYLPISGGTLTGNLRLKNSTNYGLKLNFGDGDYVYLYEDTDDHLKVYASKGLQITTGSNYYMQIDNEVVIGETSRQSAYKLYVKGAGYYSGALTVNSNLYTAALAIIGSGTSTEAARKICFGSTSYYLSLNTSSQFHFSHGVYSDSFIVASQTGSSSDRRLKDKIENVHSDRALAVIMQLRPREWEWNDRNDYLRGKRGAGLVAQEVRDVLPFAVMEAGDYLSLNYSVLHAYEIAGLQNHEKRIDALEKENRALKKRIKQLEAR